MTNKAKPQSKYLQKYETQMNMCIRCAYCFEKCPVIKETQWDTDGARGKVIMSYGLLTGDLKPSQYIADKLFRCTFCRDCLDKCPSKVEILEIIENARAELVDSGFASDTHKYIIENIKKTGNIYGDKEVIFQTQQGKTPLFVGCQYLGRPNKTKKYIKILEKLGIEPIIHEEICCGFPMQVLGFKDEYENHKKDFKKKFPYSDAVAFCPTCTVFLKEGYDIKAKHVLQVILEKLPKAELNMKVTYHDPCDFSRGLKIIDEPRKILERLGIKIVEMKNNKENSSCCGGGGGILMTDQELSNDIAKKRIREALDTGADTIVTSCPTCETTLKKAAQEISETEGKTISVRNIEDLIWKGLASIQSKKEEK